MDGFQNRTELSISSLSPGDIGNYTCSAAKDKSVSLGNLYCYYYYYIIIVTQTMTTGTAIATPTIMIIP